MTILRATLTVKCNDCGVEKTFDYTMPMPLPEDEDTEGWLLSEARDWCPPCLKAENARVAGKAT